MLLNPHLLFNLVLRPLGLFAVLQASAITVRGVAFMRFAPSGMQAIHLGGLTDENRTAHDSCHENSKTKPFSSKAHFSSVD